MNGNDDLDRDHHHAPTSHPSPTFRRHPKYWLEDGSLIIRAQDELFKVHKTLLDRHSPGIAALLANPPKTSTLLPGEDLGGCHLAHVPDDRGVQSEDVEALLGHLYHDSPLDEGATYGQAAAILRASSPEQLDFPILHRLACNRLERILRADPEAFARLEHAEEALALALKYDIPSIQKPLYYSVATHSHDHPPDAPDHPSRHLSPALAARCNALLDALIAHFTPVLFTVATARHMACTDVFAERWMPLVIQPALEENGLCTPLETLERIIAIDWAAEGLCAECVRDKREEWRGEQREVWERIDGWLG